MNYNRYIHYTTPINSKYTGFTVAYFRNGEDIFFSYALCHVRDRYVKETGRQRTNDTLAEHIDLLSEMTVLHDNFIDPELRVGHITVQTLIDSMPELSNLSNQTVASLTTEDFKHSFISNVLIDCILVNV